MPKFHKTGNGTGIDAEESRRLIGTGRRSRACLAFAEANKMSDENTIQKQEP